MAPAVIGVFTATAPPIPPKTAVSPLDWDHAESLLAPVCHQKALAASQSPAPPPVELMETPGSQ